MSYVVTTQLWPGRLIAAVQVRIVRSQIPVEFMRHLDQVYAAKASGLALDGQNVFVYSGVTGQPDLLDCAFGVGVTAPFPDRRDSRRAIRPDDSRIRDQ